MKEPKMPGKPVTVDELADHFRVTPETVRAWVRDGRIPFLRISPKVLRFDLDAVHNAVSKRVAVAKGGLDGDG